MLDPSILVGHNAIPGGTERIPFPLYESGAPMIDAEAASRSNQDQEAAKTLASVLAMQSSLDSCNTLAQASEQVVQTIKDECSASDVVLLWRTQAGKGLIIIARSGQSAASGPTTGASTDVDDQMIVAAGEEIAIRDSMTVWPSTNETDRYASMAVGQLAEEQSLQSIIAVRLSEDESAGRGVLMVINPSDSSAIGFLRVASTPLTGSLIRIADEQPTWIDTHLKNLIETMRCRRGRITLAGVVLIILLMMTPFHYRVAAPVELQPVERRFIAVPFDGPLKRVFAKAGDLVGKGDQLALMDPREIEYEIAGSQAEWNRAEQQRKSLMVKHDFAGSKLASLDSQRLKNQTDLLTHQRDQSEIRSPIDGVVVSGDVTQSEGMPMSRGESLFEVAPLGRMVVEIAVPETDFAEVRPGMVVTFYVHAFPNRMLDGTVDRIHPKAELRGNDNVFIAEVALEDPDGIYRPGMQGRASVIGDRHPLAWNLFHPAYYAVRRHVGW